VRGQGARRALGGLALGAAGMLYSRLGGKRAEPGPARRAPSAPEPEEQHPHEGGASTEDLRRARSELSEELARRAARADS
jgi:hypothetical protein